MPSDKALISPAVPISLPLLLPYAHTHRNTEGNSRRGRRAEILYSVIFKLKRDFGNWGLGGLNPNPKWFCFPSPTLQDGGEPSAAPNPRPESPVPSRADPGAAAARGRHRHRRCPPRGSAADRAGTGIANIGIRFAPPG